MSYRYTTHFHSLETELDLIPVHPLVNQERLPTVTRHFISLRESLVSKDQAGMEGTKFNTTPHLASHRKNSPMI